MHSVVQTPNFLAKAKASNIDDDEREQIVDFIASHPTAGVVIPGTGGARKVRFAGRGKGKSGGHRVITFFSGEDIPIFLLSVFSKGDRVDISQAERNELREFLGSVATEYRRGIERYVTRR